MKTIFLTLLSELRALDLVWIRRDAFAASAVSRSAALKASKPSWPPRLPAPLLPFSSFRFNPLIKPPACVRKEKRTERKRKRGPFIHTQTDREGGSGERRKDELLLLQLKTAEEGSFYERDEVRGSSLSEQRGEKQRI